ncbi:hypothetical protein ALP91_200016 [Pseudomonas savastanoi pv. glycinea]|nr:hypothetical protein ALP91_200016 [Pseudomonas savastanoi pv. glycinea]
MNALSDTQGFLGKCQSQGFGARPDEKTYSMGSHWDIRYVLPQKPSVRRWLDLEHPGHVARRAACPVLP